jgi:hypothetical protein
VKKREWTTNSESPLKNVFVRETFSELGAMMQNKEKTVFWEKILSLWNRDFAFTPSFLPYEKLSEKLFGMWDAKTF